MISVVNNKMNSVVNNKMNSVVSNKMVSVVNNMISVVNNKKFNKFRIISLEITVQNCSYSYFSGK